ncbi:MAG: PorT family protein, partial [Bacteroidales bacterium]|nr:PorT family protein [Bacteroidales bacterium]
IIIDDDGNVKTRHHKWPKFNGHWAGVDIGFNGYVNSDFNMNFPREEEYLDLRMEKSIATNLNFFEQNIPLAKNQKWGIVTGLGLAFNDYKFLRPTRLSMDSSSLEGFLYDDISIRKSKLSMYYLTLPVLFEFQTAPAYHKDGFHINLGVVIGARLSSHTKVYYNELNTDFNLTQYNPETGKYEVAYAGISPNDPKEHHYGDWFLQPFKFDASMRIGWNFLNFWANYSLNTLFREGKGPELYPWSAGITLLCF